MATTTKISLKLLVNKNSRKVVFAEAGKDFVDFLFGLLGLPLGSIMALLSERGKTISFGSLANLYKSTKDLDNSYLRQNHQNNDFLFNPMAASSSTIQSPLLQQLTFQKQEAELEFDFQHSFGFSYFPESPDRSELGGYVKGMVTYMVMDDLVVKPMSTISSITLLNTFEIKDVGCLQEMTVEVDMETGLELVNASFQSTTVLSDVFLSKNQI